MTQQVWGGGCGVGADRGTGSTADSISTLYTVYLHVLLYTVQCTLHSDQCTLYNVHCTLCTVHCELHSVLIEFYCTLPSDILKVDFFALSKI